jgi:hypothetical protein
LGLWQYNSSWQEHLREEDFSSHGSHRKTDIAWYYSFVEYEKVELTG